MSAFAIAFLEHVDLNAEVARYLQEIDATLVPFKGVFRVHGKAPEFLEGDRRGNVVVIEFPDLARARGWYRSPAYQAILPLRTRNASGFALLVDGVDAGYRARDLLDQAPPAGTRAGEKP